jgi:hypothetical protein
MPFLEVRGCRWVIIETRAMHVDLFVREWLTKVELWWQLKMDVLVCVLSSERVISQESMQMVALPHLLLNTPMQPLDQARCQQHTYISPRPWALPF